MASGAPGEVITIAGRELEECDPAEMTMDQHAYLAVAVQDAGLTTITSKVIGLVGRCMKSGREVPEREATKLAEEIILEVYRTETYGRLIAGLYLPKGTEWSRASADELEAFVRGTKGQDVADVISGAIVRVVTGFFASGLASATTSRKSSASLEGHETTATDAPSTEQEPTSAPSPPSSGS